MKTERVTLTVAHDENDRLGSASGWEWQTMVDATIGQDSESPVKVRVVEQPRGWLTGEERRFVHWWAYENREPTGKELDAFKIAAKALLARSSPPEVDLPISLSPIDEELIRAALAAAGVAVKEVGRE